jgi:hypothetical protein
VSPKDPALARADRVRRLAPAPRLLGSPHADGVIARA